MNKIEQEFINQGLAWDDDAANCASITKDIAIKFANYCHSNSWDKYELGMYSTEELFNQFIETL